MEILLLALLPLLFLIGSVVVTKTAVSRGAKRKKSVILQMISFVAVLICVVAFPLIVGAVNETATEAAASANSIGLIACALATGISCIGSGIAVASAAPAAIGATSEDPKAFSKALIFVVLGEGIAIYGVLISILIYTKC